MTIGPVTESQSRAFLKAAFEQDLPTLQTHVSTYGRQIVNVLDIFNKIRRQQNRRH